MTDASAMNAYHLLGRPHRLPAQSVQASEREVAPRPKWWRPLLELILLFTLLIALTAASTGVVYLFEEVAHPEISAFADFDGPDHPYLALVTFIGWVASIPAGFIAARLAGRDPRALWSTELRFRWRNFGLALAPALLFLGAEGIHAIASSDRSNATFTPLNFAALVVIMVMAPLQSLSEELFFRGSLVQIVGQWFSRAWLAYLLPLLYFLSGHDYDWHGMVSVVVFALCATFLTYTTRGIEAAAAVHAVGNTVAYAPDAFGMEGVNLAAVSISELVISVLATVAATAAAYVLITRRAPASTS